ncbi:meiosis-specific coiled-coil domain-containing protein MEIOC-like isoform X2 [Eleutherodactylus coqui]
MIQSMDNPLLSQFMHEIPSAAAAPQSKLYSSWSVCEDDAGAPSILGSKDESAPLDFSEPENRSNVIGQVSSFPEDANNLDVVTDWDSLSRLFPPLWAAADHQDLSDYFPRIVPGSTDFSNVLSPPLHEEQERKLPDMESLQRGFEDLGLLDSWVSSSDTCNTQVEDLLKDLYIENQTLELNSSFQPIEEASQYISNYMICNGQNSSAKASGVNSQSQKRPQEYSGVHNPWWRNDKTKGKLTKPSPAGHSKYTSGIRDGWDKDTYVNSVNDFIPLSVKPPAYYQCNPQFTKECGFQNSTHRKPYSPENFSNFPKVGNFDYRENCRETYAKSSFPHVSANEGFHQRWLETQTLRNQKQPTSPLPSPVGSTMSDGSPTHHPGYFSQVSGLPPTKKEGQPNCSAYQENRSKSFSHLSPSKEGMYHNTPPSYPPNWSPPQHLSVPGHPERYSKLSKKLNQPNNNNTERRGRRSWNTQHGKQNPPPYTGFQRKQDSNVGNVSDFINASFLPTFSLMSDLKQNQNFSFNPQTFSPPTNLAFPPPFPFSDLIDLFHYEDLNPVPPFISDLFCGDVPPPFFPFPAPFNRYRPSRNRSGPANELHLQLEECCEQWRALEKERKKTEAELAAKFPGHRISSSYSPTVPRLPTNPSRVDRLVVDQFREQARAVSLVKIMERIHGETLHVNINFALEHHLEAIHLTQARRKDEIINAANRQKQGVPRYNNERDVLALAAAMKEMVLSTRKARTAVWCALQMTLPKSSSGVTVKQEDIERALQELCPTKPPSVEVEPHTDAGFGSGREGNTFR